MFVAKVLPAATNFLMLPLVLKYLGEESFGLLQLYSTLQVISRIMDLAISAIVTREVAKLRADNAESKVIARTVSTLFLPQVAIAFFAMAVCKAISSPVATYWLHYRELTHDIVATAVVFMGLRMAVEVLASFLQAVLVGMERLKSLSSVLIGFQVLLAVTMVVVSARTHSVNSVLGSQAVVVLVQIVFLFFAVFFSLGKNLSFHLDPSVLLNNRGFFAGTFLAHCIGAVFLQVDKLVASHYLPLREYTGYSLAGSISSIFFLLVTPFYPIILPKLTRLLRHGEPDRAVRMVLLAQRLTVAALAPLSILVLTYSDWIVIHWLHKPAMIETVRLYLPWLTFGTIAFSLTDHVFSLQTAHGNRTTNLRTNGICSVAYTVTVLSVLALAKSSTNIVLIVPTLWMVAQAISWCAQSLLTGKEIMVRSIPIGRDLLYVLGALSVAALSYLLIKSNPSILISFSLSIGLFVGIIATSPEIRDLFKRVSPSPLNSSPAPQ